MWALNHSSKKFLAGLILLILCACGAEQQKIPQAQIAKQNAFQIGKHTVYLSTNKTNRLSEAMAIKYNIDRKQSLSMLNVSILRDSDNKSVTAKIDIDIKNLVGQNKKITALTFIENSYISYAFISSISNQETLLYKLKVSPENKYIKNIQYREKFYID